MIVGRQAADYDLTVVSQSPAAARVRMSRIASAMPSTSVGTGVHGVGGTRVSGFSAAAKAASASNKS
jgi:hypothetical protein